MGKKERNLLLINPWIYDFAAYDLWAKPLGLLSLAALLKENGWRIGYIDCLDIYHPALKRLRPKGTKRRPDHRGHFYREEVGKPAPLGSIPRRFYRFGLSPEVFREVLQSLPVPQAILVTSGMTYWYRGVHDEAIDIVKEAFPSVPVILGGIYATLCARHAEGISGADFVIKGWGEVQILKLLEGLTGVSPCFLPDLNDLDPLPPPAFGLYSHLDYCCVFTSRGCPFQCTYCASPLLNPRFIKRDPAQVVNEIAAWADRGVEDIAFHDDALLFDREFAIALLQGIEERGSKIRFHAPNGLHARGVTEEVAPLMRQVDFATVCLGLETCSRERQVATGGKVRNDDFQSAVQNLRQAGYASQEIGVYILVGLPGQERGEVEKTIRFVKECGARPYLAEYSPLPGTPLWGEAVKVSPFDLQGEPLFHNNTILPCRWEGLGWDDLQALKAMVHREG